ncbi:PMEI domain-containing protein [Psidium guajava]|nr:PMEI domain-containing protein [Psidium guajava]
MPFEGRNVWNRRQGTVTCAALDVCTYKGSIPDEFTTLKWPSRALIPSISGI